MARAPSSVSPCLKKSRTIRLVCSLFLAVLTHGASAQPTSSDIPDSFYLYLLDSLTNATPEFQIARLRDYIEKNLHEERAYLKLWELYQQHNRGLEAVALFQTWVDKPERRRNSLWMLAKTAAREGRRDTALVMFSQALRDDRISPSSALLYDYVRYGYEPSDSHNLRNLLGHVRSQEYDQTLVKIFHQYTEADYNQACASFIKISARAQQDPLLLYLWVECLEHNEQEPYATCLAEADSLSNLGLAMAQNRRAWEWQSRFTAKLGDLAFGNDEYERAQAYYDSAYVRAERWGDLWGLHKATAGRGKTHYMKGAYERADSLYQNAITYAQVLGADREVSLHYSNKSQPLYEIGKYAEALQACEEGKRYARQARDEEGLIRIELQLAKLYHALRQHNYAKQICLKQVQTARAKFIKLSYRAETRLADIFFDEKDFAAADSLYDRYLDYLSHTHNDFERHNYTSKKADILRAQKQYDRAVALYEQARREAAAVQAADYEAWYLLEIAQLEAGQGKLDRALQRLQAISQEALSETPEGLIQFNLSLGQVLQKRGEWERACYAYREAAARIDTSRQKLTLDQLRIGYFRERARPYQGLAECFFRLHQTNGRPSDLDSLFKYLQLSRGRSFHDQTAGDRNWPGGNAGEPAKNYREACERLQDLQTRLRKSTAGDSSARLALEALRYSVVYQQPGSGGRRDSSRSKTAAFIPSVAAAQKIMHQLEAGLLLYHLSDETSFVFALTAKDCRAIPLEVTRTELDAAVKTLLSPFHADTIDEKNVARLPFHAALAHELHEALIKPVKDKIVLLERLVIVPDGALTNLPFEMLMENPPARKIYTPSDSPDYAASFLLQHHAFAYSPTLGMLLRERDARFSPARVLVFANTQEEYAVLHGPQEKARVFEPLPFTALEAARIEEKSSRAKIFTRANADEAAFVQAAPQSRVAHFATHAFVDPEFDAFSGLILSENGGDGFLMGYEIAGMHLPCDLVALSACETGLGELAEGEGVLGLPRLFLRAGAESVLMTLWRVHDEFASELMPEFYDLYLNKNFSKAEALAQAKRTLLRERKMNAHGLYYQHPFFWSAFALYCDPGQNDAGLPPVGEITLLALALLLLIVAAYFLFYYKKRARGLRAKRA